MKVAVSSRNCCYWPLPFKKRIQAFCDLEMREIEYHLFFESDVTEPNIKFLQEKVDRGEVEIVGVHGNLTDNRLERIADKLGCSTISVHVNRIDLQRIFELSRRYKLLIEYPEDNAENKQSLMHLLDKVGEDTGVLVDLPEVYHYELVKGTIREHLLSFWDRIRGFHISDITGYLYNMAVGMGLGKVDFTVIREFDAPAIIEIHPNYGIFDLIASKYNLEKIVYGKAQLPNTRMLEKYSEEFDLKNYEFKSKFHEISERPTS